MEAENILAHGQEAQKKENERMQNGTIRRRLAAVTDAKPDSVDTQQLDQD